MRNKTIKIEK